MTTHPTQFTLRLLTLASLGPMMVLPSFAQSSPYFYGGVGAGRAGVMIEEMDITNEQVPLGVRSDSIARDDRDTTYKIFGGYQFNRNVAIEAGYFNLGKFSWDSTTVPAGNLHGQVQFQGMNLDLVGTAPITERFSMLGRVGAAWTRTRGEYTATGAAGPVLNPTPSDRAVNLKLGAGLQYDFAPGFIMRGEFESYRVSDALDRRGRVNAVTVSLVFPFGRTAAPAPRMAAAPAYVAPPAPMPAPAPAVVAAPPPPPPAPAPMPRRVTLSAESLFGFDRAALRPEGTAALDTFARELEGTSYDVVTVEGHTDRLGSPAYNQKLSMQRADTVKTYLVTNGRVDASRITAVGKGETMPVTKPEDCKGQKQTAALIACLQPDRRVEIEVTGTK